MRMLETIVTSRHTGDQGGSKGIIRMHKIELFFHWEQYFIGLNSKFVCWKDWKLLNKIFKSFAPFGSFKNSLYFSQPLGQLLRAPTGRISARTRGERTASQLSDALEFMISKARLTLYTRCASNHLPLPITKLVYPARQKYKSALNLLGSDL